MADAKRQLVSTTPRLPVEFARAVATAGIRPGALGTLPDRQITQQGVRVDRAHLGRYQRLCGFPLSDTVPHTYPHLLGFPLQAKLMAARDFPLPMPGMVHVRNDTQVYRALSAEETFDITVGARNLAPHAKGTTVELSAYAEVDGERVWESTSTYLVRGKKAVGEVTEETPAPGVPSPRPSAIWSLPGNLGLRYAAVSGDVNPIHLNPWTARAMGFPRTIAHGMWTAARTLAAIGPQVNQPCRSQVWFRKPVLLPSKVGFVLEGDVAALVAPKDPAKVHLLLHLDR